MIRSILFDLGNVLVPFEIDRGYAALSANGGLPVDEIAVRIRESGLYPAFESGEFETTEFHERFSRLLDLKATPAEFRDLWDTCVPSRVTNNEQQKRPFVFRPA